MILLSLYTYDELIRIYEIIESEANSFAFMHQKFSIRHGFNNYLLDHTRKLEVFNRYFAQSSAFINIVIADILVDQYRKVET